ncbi:MAG: hypothetical protein ACWA5P_11725 [bacterium]
MSRLVAEIRSYEVGFARTLDNRGINDFDRVTIPYKTYLKLSLSGIGARVINKANLYFTAPKFIQRTDSYADRKEFGVIRNNEIELYLEEADFDHCYKIIQSEKPLVLFWENREIYGEDIITSWKVSTSSPELPGEGDIDN